MLFKRHDFFIVDIHIGWPGYTKRGIIQNPANNQQTQCQVRY